MGNLLIIAKQRDVSQALSRLARPLKFNNIDITDSANEARRLVQRKDYNLIIINTPLHHEFGDDLALDFLERDGVDVVLIVKSSDLQSFSDKLYKEPIFIIERPLNKETLLRNLNYILSVQKRNERVTKNYSKLKKNLENQKIQFRAKLVLMEKLNMSEEEAHRYIQKQAMDSRRTPAEVSKSLIEFYQNK